MKCGKDVLKRMSENLSKLTPEKAKEVPMVDLAFNVLKAANTPFYYRDLMAEVAKVKGFTDEEIMQVIAQLYTEINVDGRFACVGNNLWGLKRWYPVDNKEGEMGTTKRPRIINDDDDDLDEEEYLEEEEDAFVADDDEFDAFDEDREDLIAEEEEEVFAPEDAEEEAEEADEVDEIEGALDEEGTDDSEFEDDLAEEDSEDDEDDK
jgi:DNA-directed RNA polymerase subunit delta